MQDQTSVDERGRLKRNGTGLPITLDVRCWSNARNAADPALVDGRSSRKIINIGEAGRAGANCEDMGAHRTEGTRDTMCLCESP